MKRCRSFVCRENRLLGAVTLIAAFFVVAAVCRAQEETPAAEEKTEEAVKPQAVDPPSPESLEGAISRGVDYLLGAQNRNGSWGSADSSRPDEIYAPLPGAHHAFRAGTTSLCVLALLETGGDRPEAAKAIDRGEQWLLENLPHLKRASPDAIYNTWGHAYAIETLVRLLDRQKDDAPRAEKLRAAIRQQIEMAGRYELVDGGWAYYDFAAHTQKPSGSSISFVSATMLISLHDAQAAGFDVSEKIVDRAKASILRQRKPDFSYCYGEYLKYRPMHPVNRPGGSLGRSQVCNLAMRLWGDKAVTDEVMKTWLDRIFARNLWLDMGRKRPVPHESWFSVAEYFFYFGHYYAALCIEQLPEADRSFYQNHLAHVLLRLQEKDGTWWDFPMYDYHKQYGTAFALMALKRCRATTGQ